MFVCLYLIQIHVSEPISTKLCTHLPHGLEENVGYVRSHIFFFIFRPFPPSLSRAGADYRKEDGRRVPITGQKMAAGASHPRRRYIRDSNWSLCDVTEKTS